MGLDVWLTATRPIEVYSRNITHNLTGMASAAGIYEVLWRPEEVGIGFARDLIIPLSNGLKLMKADPEKFKAFEALNGWGTYTDFVGFVEDYLTACITNPDAIIGVSR